MGGPQRRRHVHDSIRPSRLTAALGLKMKIKTERQDGERERQTDRQTDRQADKQTNTQTDRTHCGSYLPYLRGVRDRQIETKRERQRQTQTDKPRCGSNLRGVGSLDVEPGRGSPEARGPGIPLRCGEAVLAGDRVRPGPGPGLRVRPAGERVRPGEACRSPLPGFRARD